MMPKKKVLVCDDDEGILDMIMLALEDENIEVVTTSNSLKLQQMVQRLRPDILLLDLWMPLLSGDVILRQFRAIDSLANLPVIVMSASRDGEEIARENGATDFISKPFDIDNLSLKITQLISL